MVQIQSEPWRLLIADDNDSFRAVLREILEPLSVFLIHEVESGEEALEYARSERVDIALLDMHMHLLTGLDTLRQLKSLDAVRPCILITSDSSQELRQEAASANAFRVLRKPVRRKDLLSTVDSAIHSAYSAF